MAATENSGLGHGTKGSPQSTFDEQEYSQQVNKNETNSIKSNPPVYVPSPKHQSGSGWGSPNPIKSQAEGQKLLNEGYKQGKQIYNITSEGRIVKFQPDNTSNNGYHSYEVTSPKDLPAGILKQMLSDGKISKSDYNKLRKGKR